MRKLMMYLVITILGTISAAYILTGTSTPANAATCSSIHGTPESRFNPTSLSPYQECILDQYKADEAAGTLGSLFWVRNLDGSYTSMQTTMLVQSGSEAAAIAMVTKAVFENTQAALIDTLTELDETQAILDFTKAKLANKKARIKRLVAKRDRLKAKLLRIADALTAAPVVPSVSTGAIQHNYVGEARAYSAARNHIAGLASAIRMGTWPNSQVLDILTNSNHAYHVELRAEIQYYVEQETTRAFVAGYEAGYDDGYQAGYADGYSDGWNDAMDSVQ